MAFLLFLLTIAAADFTYTTFTGKSCSQGNVTLTNAPETNGVCISHSGASAIVDCGPSGLVFNVWKWSSSATCSGVPDISLVAPTGACEAVGESSLQINCKASEKLNSAGSLAQRLLAKKSLSKANTVTTPAPKKKKNKKKKTVVKAQATVTPTATPTATSSCPATGAPIVSPTNAQGKPITVFPEGNTNGRNACGQINGPATATPTTATKTPKPVKKYAATAAPTTTAKPKKKSSVLFP